MAWEFVSAVSKDFSLFVDRGASKELNYWAVSENRPDGSSIVPNTRGVLTRKAALEIHREQRKAALGQEVR